MLTTKRRFLPGLLGPLALGVAVLSAALVNPAVMAAEPTAIAVPPRTYRLESLELRVQVQPGHGQAGQMLIVAGAGGVTLVAGRPAARLAFRLPTTDVVALVNGLYRLRFFDLPPVLGGRSSVYLLPDGTVGTQLARLSDATANTVCFTLPGYEKCVRYLQGQGPKDLEAWVQATFADAQRRAQPAPSEK